MNPSLAGIPVEHQKLFICIDTGEVAQPSSHTKGSLGVEILLWLFFLVPGMIYSAWRLSTRAPAIGGNRNIIKVATPRGAELYRQYHAPAQPPVLGREPPLIR